ncbi:hypothetical protein ABIE93_005947 [Bradyrhizobium elkanii]|uniref:hypothetical protein n=1 Tax=Bradyrhizobium elkanii TaxID=29448 RepID=UPI003513DE2E
MRENTQNESGRHGGSVTEGLPKFRIKVPQTLDQAAKLRKWLEQIAHKTSLPARNFVSNLIYQIKGAKTQADLDRFQPFMAYQAERLAEASR